MKTKNIVIIGMFFLTFLFTPLIMSAQNTLRDQGGTTLSNEVIVLWPGTLLQSTNGKYRLENIKGRLVITDVNKNRILWVHQFWNFKSKELKEYTNWLKTCLNSSGVSNRNNLHINTPNLSSYISPFPTSLRDSLQSMKDNHKEFEFMFYMKYFFPTTNGYAKIYSPNGMDNFRAFADAYDQLLDAWYHRQNPITNPADKNNIDPNDEYGYIKFNFPKTQIEPFVDPDARLYFGYEGLGLYTANHVLRSVKKATSHKGWTLSGWWGDIIDPPPSDITIEFPLWGVLTPSMRNRKLVLQNDGNLQLIADVLTGDNADITKPINHFDLIAMGCCFNYRGDQNSYCTECTTVGVYATQQVVWESHTSETEILANDTKNALKDNMVFNKTYISTSNEVIGIKGYGYANKMWSFS